MVMRIMIMMMTDCEKIMKTVIVSVNKMRKLVLILLSGQAIELVWSGHKLLSF